MGGSNEIKTNSAKSSHSSLSFWLSLAIFCWVLGCPSRVRLMFLFFLILFCLFLGHFLFTEIPRARLENYRNTYWDNFKTGKWSKIKWSQASIGLDFVSNCLFNHNICWISWICNFLFEFKPYQFFSLDSLSYYFHIEATGFYKRLYFMLVWVLMCILTSVKFKTSFLTMQINL